MMSIPASTAVAMGDGFAQCRLRGSQSNDWMRDGGFLSNHAGGVIGGISTGQPIVMEIGFKPTSSIAQTQQTMDIHGRNREIQVIGRHDPCIVPRAVPIVESMAALTLLDAWEIQERLRGEWPSPEA
ncbi:MAG: Chorismate synthase [candidate division BRC1 bacterium ADurb.BinA364]|nr:MAG: Chorismate synthase [candidate division BRC1 bacterium ADurb.BinA364]